MDSDAAAPDASHLDWSAYAQGGFGAVFGDPFGTPAAGVDGFRTAVSACNGRKACLQPAPGAVMCPSFRVTGDPAHATEHRAQVLKAALEGRLGDSPFASPEVDEALALCVGCKACKRECPQAVDMAAMAIEARARRWQALGGVPWRVRLQARAPQWARRLRPLLWLRERSPLLRRLAERGTGIAAARTLPQASRRSFLDAHPEPSCGRADGREVVLLADSFSDTFEPEVLEAALQVLLAGGYRVHLPRAAKGEPALDCGKSLLAAGLVDEARAAAERLVHALAPYTARQCPVIGVEPSFQLMLRDELQMLGLGPGAGALGRCSRLLEEFLAEQAAAGSLRLELRPRPGQRVLVHGHCHQKAFGVMPAMLATLALVPGLEIEVVEASCCGMAGTFGLQAENHASSMAMAEAGLLPAVRQTSAGTLLVANGMSCRHQIRDGSGRSAMHLAMLLRDALPRSAPAIPVTGAPR